MLWWELTLRLLKEIIPTVLSELWIFCSVLGNENYSQFREMSSEVPVHLAPCSSEGLGLTCLILGSSCLSPCMYLSHLRCGSAKGDKGSIFSFSSSLHNLSATCRDSFHFSLMNYHCVIIVTAWSEGRGWYQASDQWISLKCQVCQ